MSWNNGKKHGYREGVACVALNDEPLQMDPKDVSGLPSVCLLAYLFNKDPDNVAKDVVKYRSKNLFNS